MTTYEILRCEKCSWLITYDDELVCCEAQEEIHNIPDEECVMLNPEG